MKKTPLFKTNVESDNETAFYEPSRSIHMVAFWITLFGMSFFLIYCFFEG